MDKAIDATASQYARELCSKSKPNAQPKSNNAGNTQKMCTTYNSFRKPGCQYEHSNPGEQCVYLHVCKKCKTTKGLNLRHKEWQCTEQDVPKTSGSGNVSVSSAVVTSA